VAWLDEYLEYAKNNEGLENFHWWAGAAILGAVLKRNVYFSKGYYNVYPPFWLLIVSESGTKKTTSLNIAYNILSKLDTVKLLPDKSSPEALAKALAEDEEGEEDDAQGLIYAPELANFMDNRKHNSGLVQLLLRLADCPDKWVYRTIKGGKVNLKNIAVSFLGATTSELVRECVPPIALKTGFLARFICISGVSTPKIIAFPWKDMKLEMEVINSLYEISLLKGVMKMGKPAEEWYLAWYFTHRRDFAAANSERLRAYLQRKPDYLIRLAIIIAVSDTKMLTLTVNSFEKALVKLNGVEDSLQSIYTDIEATTHGREQLMILDQIKRSPDGISHKELLRRNSKILSEPEKFRRLMGLLYEAGEIKMVKKNNTHYYKCTI